MDIKLPSFSLRTRLKSLVLVSPYAFGCLTLSSSWMAVSAYVDCGKINLAASGAIMVALAIVAELFHSRWEFSWIIRRGRGAAFHDLPKIQPIGYNTDRVSEILQPLAKKSEYDSQLGDWYVGTTTVRLDLRINIVIGAMAIIGSVVWGYG